MAFGFVDLCGFTRLSAHHGDARAAAVILSFRRAVQHTAEESGVVIHRWLGDGVMLVGDDIAAMVTTAQQLDDRVCETAAGLAARAGIAWGSVQRIEDDYIGRATNLASRLCDRAGPHQLFVDEAGMQKLGNPESQPRTEILRGIPTPVTFADLGRCSHATTRVIDPVCGMEVDPDHASPRTHRGQDAWFCSTACADLWTQPEDDWPPEVSISRLGVPDSHRTLPR